MSNHMRPTCKLKKGTISRRQIFHSIMFPSILSVRSAGKAAHFIRQIVTEGKMPYQRRKGLKEWNFGAFEGKDECLNPAHPYADFFKQFGGEGEKEFQTRFSDAVSEIMKEDNEIVLIVAHGAACGQFARKWREYGKVELRPGIGNCAIFRYDYEDGIFSLQEIITHDFSSIQ